LVIVFLGSLVSFGRSVLKKFTTSPALPDKLIAGAGFC